MDNNSNQDADSIDFDKDEENDEQSKDAATGNQDLSNLGKRSHQSRDQIDDQVEPLKKQ